MDINPSNVSSLLGYLTAYRYVMAATTTVFVYEYLLVIDEEIRLVWRARLSLVKILYLLNRTLACALVISNLYIFRIETNSSSCRPLFSAVVQLIILVFCVCEVMLFMRVYALWQSSKRLILVLGTIVLTAITSFIYIAERDTMTITAGSAPDIFGDGCYIGQITYLYWVPHFILLMNESTMLTFTLIKAYSATKNASGHILSRGYRVIAHDGIAYFISFALLSLTSVFFIRLVPVDLRLLLAVMHAIIQSTLCSRLLLRLRGAYRQLSDVTSFSVATFRGKAENPIYPDIIRRRFHEFDTMPDECIAMDEISSERYGLTMD